MHSPDDSSAGRSPDDRATDDPPRFAAVDWTDVDPTRRRLSPERATLLVGFAALVVLYLYDTYVVDVYLIGTWNVANVDWVTMLGTVILVAYVGVPAVRRRETTFRIVRHLRSRPSTAFAATFLAVFVLVAVIGPLVLGWPSLQYRHRYHPPLFFTGEAGWTVECLGGISQGEGITRYCHGSPTYPLGTNERGHPMGLLTVTGARIALYVLVFTAAFVVPIATVVGVVAGLRGGLVDDLLMGYVDIQLCIPAMIVYFIGYIYWNTSLLLLLVTFGLFSWGGIARLVRSEVLQRREAGYVLVARSLGASDSYLARRHIVPNVTNTLVPAAFHLLALLVLVEAGVAFLGFHEVDFFSWGSTIQEGLEPYFTGGIEMDPHEVWWISLFPTIAMTLTLLSLKLVGDGLRDALDPRGENR